MTPALRIEPLRNAVAVDLKSRGGCGIVIAPCSACALCTVDVRQCSLGAA